MTSPDVAHDHIHTPLLMYRTGALGSAPLDFPERLAEHLEVKFLSGDVMRLDIADARNAPASDVPSDDIRARFASEARLELEAGGDVVLDMFFNSETTRAKTPKMVAERSGAMTVALVTRASPGISFDRVGQ